MTRSATSAPGATTVIRSRPSERVALAILSLSLLFALLATPGCYYGHLARGQARLLWASRSVDDVLADPSTPESLRAKLALVERVRVFARDLGLEVDGQYTSYAAWPGDRVVTSLIVTEPGSIEARPFSFPVVGSVPYKGFFDEGRARAEAERLGAEGLDTCLVAVPAYSTLGFFDDPLTDPMLRYGDGQVVETVLHELVHATAFVDGDAALSESVAQFIGEEASVRFFADAPEQAARRRAEVRDDRLLAAALMTLRDDVAALYAEHLEPAERVRRRAFLERDARGRLAALPLETRDAAQLARDIRLGDACLALRGTYVADQPRHAALLAALGGDLRALVARWVAAAASDDPRARFFSPAGEPAGARQEP